MRSIFLLHNYLRLYIFVVLSVRALRFNSTFLRDTPFWSTVGMYLFSRFVKIIYLPINYLKHVVIGQSFYKSLHYTYLKKISHLSLSPVIFTKTYNLNHYLYMLSTSVVRIPTTSKYGKYLLNQILQYWLNIWVQWPKFYYTKLTFLCTPRWWQLAYFLNVFYFKVYNM
jgi:hypothetical protein